MGHLSAAPAVIHQLPGRIRLHVPAIHRRQQAAAVLEDRLFGLAGVSHVRADARAGRVLVLYDPARISVRALQAAVTRPDEWEPPAGSLSATPPPPGVPVDVLAQGALLGVVGARRLMLGRAALNAAPWLPAASAAAGVISTYPQLRHGLHRLSRGRGRSVDLLLATGSLALSVIRGSVPGLLVLWLLSLTRWGEQVAFTRAQRGARAVPAADVPGVRRAAEHGERQGQPANLPEPEPATAYSPGLTAGIFLLAGAVLAVTRNSANALAVLVAASPRALHLARSATRTHALAAAVHAGIFPRTGAVIEAAGQIDAAALEMPALVDEDAAAVATVTSLHARYPVARILSLAAHTLGPLSLPVSRALTRQVSADERAAMPDGSQVQVVPGQGAILPLNGRRVMAGLWPLMQAHGVATRRAQLHALMLEARGEDVVYIAHGRRLVGVIGVRHPPRPEAMRLAESLRSLGVLHMGTLGTDALALHAGLSHHLGLQPMAMAGGHSPDQAVQQLRASGKKTLVVAGSAQSGAALASAHVGVAPTGSPAAHQAHAVIAAGDLNRVTHLVRLGQQTREVRRQNEIVATAFTAIGLVLAVSGPLSLGLALLLHEAAALAVLANSRRLLGTGTGLRAGQVRRPRAVAGRSHSTNRRPKVGGPLPPMGGGQGPAQLLPASSARPLVPARPAPARPTHVRPVARGPVTAPAVPAPASPWHALGAAEVASHLGTATQRGLSAQQAMRRLARFGPNALVQVRPPSMFQLFIRQFQNVMVLTLFGASGLSLLAGAVTDALTVLGVVVINGLFGMAQEYHTSRLVTALDRLAAPTARVIRDGELQVIPAEQLVAGDLIQLEPGDRVPADARLVEIQALEVEESSLTGESVPVPKHAISLAAHDLTPGDRTNMVFQGTSVTRGRATAIIVATGMGTEMGRILSLLKEAETAPTPLQRRLDDLGRTLLRASVALAAAVIGLGLLRGNAVMPMVMTGVGLAVAAIPEGLAAVVTIALATGVRRIARRQAIARRLSAVETLATVAVICSDKTGTMTHNELHVRAVYAGGRDWHLTPAASEAQPPGAADPAWPGWDMTFALEAAAACNDGAATVPGGSRTSSPGDPMDAALRRAVGGLAAPEGHDSRESLGQPARLAEIPFDPERRRVTVLLRGEGGRIYLVTKGAAEVVTSLCTRLRHDGQEIVLTPEEETKANVACAQMAAQGLRVVAVSCRELSEMPQDHDLPALEAEMTFLGLIGMADPPRPEVAAAVARCHRAGVRVVMITGDHPDTAVAVAEELGIVQPGGHVLTGSALDRLSDDELGRLLPSVQVCARVAPRHKLRIVRAFKRAGYVVAMTGDGVNDAPAVKEADVGIAMGGSGTATTKEASDLILTDDNFATIVKAMEEGRGIRSNIRKALGFLLAGNAGEVLLMLLGVLVGWPLPLLPIQLLLVNLLTDGLPTLVLACGRPEPDLLDGAPVSAEESLFSRGLGRQIVRRGAVIGLGTFAMYAWLLRRGGLGRARSMTLALLVLSQWAQVPDWQFEGQPGRFPDRPRDPWLLASVGASAAVLPTLFHVPALARIFQTVPLSAADWLKVAASSVALGALSRGVRRGSGPQQAALPADGQLGPVSAPVAGYEVRRARTARRIARTRVNSATAATTNP